MLNDSRPGRRQTVHDNNVQKRRRQAQRNVRWLYYLNTSMHFNIIMLVCRGCMHKYDRGDQTRRALFTAHEFLLFIHCMQLFARRSKYVKAGAEAK